MSTLDLTPRLSDPDGLFEALVAAHRGLDAEASRRLDARLVLILANHIGEVDVVREAIAEAVLSAREAPLRDAPAREAPAGDAMLRDTPVRDAPPRGTPLLGEAPPS